MYAEVRVLTGARAGLVSRLAREDVLVGRHPECGLQFHPTLDLEVSARHALIVRQGDRWFLRDLESRNGTFVNGRRIASDMLLWEGDRITLGMTGPAFEFRLIGLPLSAPTPELAGTTVGAAWPMDGADRRAEGPGDGDRESTALRQNRRLRWLSGSMVVILLAVMAMHFVDHRAKRTAWDQERAGMQLRIDSLLHASEASAAAMEGILDGLTVALRQSQDEIRRVHVELRSAQVTGDRSRVESLRSRLETATLALDRQQTIAALDFRGIERRNRRAVAKVYVEYDDGEVATATAFAVRPDATLLTSRHVVAGTDGRRGVRRMAVQFSDSDQIWPARLLSLASDADLALVRVDNIVGAVPVVQSLNLRSDTVSAGAPVALIGYPLGGQEPSPNGPTRQIARPVLSAGVISGRRADRLELQGYGAAGASGSPIFDGNGEVVAVLFGGQRRADGNQTLYSVPASIVSRLLERTP